MDNCIDFSSGQLRPYDAYLAYGFISCSSVIELLHRRTYASVNGSRRALSSNMEVEKALGHIGILCLNDLVNEVYTVGPNFDKVTDFLMPYNELGLKRQTPLKNSPSQ